MITIQTTSLGWVLILLSLHLPCLVPSSPSTPWQSPFSLLPFLFLVLDSNCNWKFNICLLVFGWFSSTKFWLHPHCHKWHHIFLFKTRRCWGCFHIVDVRKSTLNIVSTHFAVWWLFLIVLPIPKGFIYSMGKCKPTALLVSLVISAYLLRC